MIVSPLAMVMVNCLVTGGVDALSPSWMVKVTVPAAVGAPEMTPLTPYSYAVEKHAIQAAVEAVLADPARAIDATEATYQAMLPSFSMRESMCRIAAFCALHPLNAAL